MNKNITGSITVPLAKSDAGGNYGYSLSFDYKYQEDNPRETIEYSNIKFGGPGTWEDFSEGDEYPYSQMFAEVMRSTN